MVPGDLKVSESFNSFNNTKIIGQNRFDDKKESINIIKANNHLDKNDLTKKDFIKFRGVDNSKKINNRTVLKPVKKILFFVIVPLISILVIVGIIFLLVKLPGNKDIETTVINSETLLQDDESGNTDFENPQNLDIPVIKWEDAIDNVGKELWVSGIVIEASYKSSIEGKPTFLNMGNSFPSGNMFTVTIFDDIRGDIINKYKDNPETYFLNKEIKVYGLIVTYEYEIYNSNPKKILKIPEIILNNPENIIVIK